MKTFLIILTVIVVYVINIIICVNHRRFRIVRRIYANGSEMYIVKISGWMGLPFFWHNARNDNGDCDILGFVLEFGTQAQAEEYIKKQKEKIRLNKGWRLKRTESIYETKWYEED